jgi:YfiH family protein
VARVGAPGRVEETDALVTDMPGVYLCVTIADCVPILMVDPEHRAVAAVHAGWRGSAAGVLSLTLKLMRSAFGTRPEGLLAYIGPSAGGCCYEVGTEVAERFPAKYVDECRGSRRLDLKAFNADTLRGAGVSTARMEISPLCTITESALLHSHRRDGSRSGRMMAVIGIHPQGS